MQDIRHEHHSRLSVSNYNVLYYSKSKCHQSFFNIYVWNSVPLYIRNWDSLKLFKELCKEYLLARQ